MPHSTAQEKRRRGDAELVRRALAKDETAIREIIRRHNQKLYRISRSILRDEGEAEDVLQEAYLKAFSSLARFRGDAYLSTWLTRIVINEALQRLRRRVELTTEDGNGVSKNRTNIIPFPLSETPEIDPERALAQKQLTKLIENAIDKLPEDFRVVLVARTIDDMSVQETADLLGIKAETVKTRLFRARRLIKKTLSEDFDSLFEDIFPFAGKRCERLTDAVIAHLERTT